jgi:hypothetical protein
MTVRPEAVALGRTVMRIRPRLRPLRGEDTEVERHSKQDAVGAHRGDQTD